jgi:acetyl-CoA acetyltransferase
MQRIGVSCPVYGRRLPARRGPHTDRPPQRRAGRRASRRSCRSRLKSLVERSPDLDPAQIEDVIFGDANQAGEDNRSVARMAVLLAGLPTSIPGATVNRLCGSGMEATARRAGDRGRRRVAARLGGVESMSRAPWVMLKPEKPYARTHETMHSTTLGWRMVNPDMPDDWTSRWARARRSWPTATHRARRAGRVRAAQPPQRAAAWDRGVYDDEVVAVPDTELERDETIRPDTSVEKLAKLKPAFRKDGTVTAGNSSPLNDGAAALLLGDEAGARRRARAAGAHRLARGQRDRAAAVRHRPGRGGQQGARSAPASAGATSSSSSSTRRSPRSRSPACASGPSSIRRSSTPNGGAIAIGHPLGCSGARLLTSLAHELKRRGGGWGLATMCIGVGQGIAMVLEA